MKHDKKYNYHIDFPADAALLFKDRLSLACRYAEILSTTGIEYGLLGPREAVKIWDRHILNSAVIAQLIDQDLNIVDIGSGAGLPGIPLAIARPDLKIVLVEPLLRRVKFLENVIQDLQLPIEVIRGKAESSEVRNIIKEYDVAVSRAVTSVDKLTQWSFPLLKSNGLMIAIKGKNASVELEEHYLALKKMGAQDIEIVHCDANLTSISPVTVIIVKRKF